MTENMKKLLDIPIRPQDMQVLFDEYSGVDDEIPTNKNVVTYKTSFPSEVFIAIEQIGKVIHEGTRWNKKARIVLEYDPQVQKMAIVSIMEQDEAIHLERFAKWRECEDHCFD